MDKKTDQEMIKLRCHQCGEMFESRREKKPRSYVCSKKCYDKYHKTKAHK